MTEPSGPVGPDPQPGFPPPPPPGTPPPYGQVPPPPYGQPASPYGQPPPPVPGGPGVPAPGWQLPPGTYLDPASGVLLPTGTQLASVGRRIGAWFLAIPLVIVTLFIGYVIWGAIIWSRGQTPALQVLRMRCWRPQTAEVPGWGYMALREIVGRFVEGILSFITLLVSFVMMLTSRERKTLHDLVAGTVVVHDPNLVLDRWPR